jgi:hypothetical protein
MARQARTHITVNRAISGRSFHAEGRRTKRVLSVEDVAVGSAASIRSVHALWINLLQHATQFVPLG